MDRRGKRGVVVVVDRMMGMGRRWGAQRDGGGGRGGDWKGRSRGVAWTLLRWRGGRAMLSLLPRPSSVSVTHGRVMV